MAILKGPYYGRRSPSLMKHLVVREWRGQIVLAAWPRKAKRPLHPKTVEANEKFRQAQILSKYLISQQQVLAREASEGTPLLPRDLLTAAMYGRLWAIDIVGEGTFYSNAMVSDVSQNLDIIGQTPGDTMARAAEGWEAVAGGETGQVLTSQGPDQKPTWAGAAGGGGSKAFTSIELSAKNTGANSARGWVFTPLLPLSISHAVVSHTEINTATYKVVIFTTTGNTVNAVVAATPIFTGTANGDRTRLFTFDNPVPLVAGTEYVIVAVRTDAAPTTGYGMFFQINAAEPVPCAFRAQSVEFATVDPLPTQTFIRGTVNAILCVNIVYTL